MDCCTGGSIDGYTTPGIIPGVRMAKYLGANLIAPIEQDNIQLPNWLSDLDGLPYNDMSPQYNVDITLIGTACELYVGNAYQSS